VAHNPPEHLLKKLESLSEKFSLLTTKLSQPDIISDRKVFQETSVERSSLEDVVDKFASYKKNLKNYSGAIEIRDNEKDPDLLEMAKEESSELEKILDQELAELKILLLPKDPNDHKNIIIELRAGVGGDEAGLFVGDMYRAYSKFAEKNKYSVELMSTAENSSGGYREIVALIKGNGAYSTFKYESGSHRVQRVPQTETQGRIHTSTITIAILPEAEDIDLEINPVDLKIETCRASGAGGQHVNTTDSAVRIVHLPTGEVVQCQDERSQIKNKAKALKVLRSRILQKMHQKAADKEAENRKEQVGSGFRNERIRTYNFPQGRVTDHRINLTAYNVDQVIEGDFKELINSLARHYQLEALKDNG